MILGETKLTIIVNAGHYDDPLTLKVDDPGAVRDRLIEQVECIKIRDALVPLLTNEGFKVLSVPDHLNLAQSIDWINKQIHYLNDALAIDIHLNALSDTKARGTEAFHGTSITSEKIAEALSEEVAKQLGIPDRGAKPDTQTAVGQLGWIRKTNCWSTLIEVCFISNKEDMDALRADGGYRKAAKGIRNGVLKIFGIPIPNEDTITTPEENQKIVEMLNDAEEWLHAGIALVDKARKALQ